MKKKIFIFHPYPSFGGGDTTLNKFISSINKVSFDVYFLSLGKVKKKHKNLKYILLKSKSTFFSVFEIKKIIEKRFHNDKIIFFSMQYFVNTSVLLILKKLKNLKFFIHEINHPIELSYSDNTIEFFKKIIIRFLITRVYKKAHIVSSNSKETSSELSRICGCKVLTILNPSFIKKNIKRQKYSKKNILKILNIARLEKQKDHLTLLKGIKNSYIKDKLQLTILGNGRMKNQILNYANNNKIKLKIIENETNLQKYYLGNDLFVFSSIYEGMPTVLIEAASYRLPIISSNFTSGAKEIFNGSKNGYIFNKGDWRKLSILLNLFYKNQKPFYEKEKKCFKNLNKFSMKKNLSKFNNILSYLT